MEVIWQAVVDQLEEDREAADAAWEGDERGDSQRF